MHYMHKEIYAHDQDRSINFPSGSRQWRVQLHHFDIKNTVM